MPRPKSEITGKQISVAVRVTASQKAAFKQLAAEIERNWKQEQPSLGKKIISRVFGR
jgi:TRAP-type C4-dicarboxylate transport system substrate-binding protein